MTYHQTLLTQFAPLEAHEVASLREWLSALKEDVELFGATPEDTARIARIESRIEGASRFIAYGPMDDTA